MFSLSCWHVFPLFSTATFHIPLPTQLLSLLSWYILSTVISVFSSVKWNFEMLPTVLFLIGKTKNMGFPGGPAVGTPMFPLQAARVQSLVGNLRSHSFLKVLPKSEKTNRKKKKNNPWKIVLSVNEINFWLYFYKILALDQS